MPRRFISILSLVLIFALAAGPLVVVAQTEVLAPESDIQEIATSTEQVLPTETTGIVIAEEVVPVVAFVETIDPDTYVPGEVIVKYKESQIDLTDSADEKLADAIAETLDLDTVETIDTQNISVLSTEGTSVEQAIESLEANPNVEYAEPNYVRNIETLSSTSPELATLWALQNTGQVVDGITGVADADTDALEAWSTATGTDVIVAVIDTGVDYTHPDLANNMWDGSACVDENGGALGSCVHGYDFEYNTLDPLATSTGSTESHGTHVSGIIAASHNDSGVVGIAHGAKIMALRFGLDTATEVKAIDFAIQNGAKIINASYSGSHFSQAEYDAIQRFQNAGGIFVASAANEGDDLDSSATLAYPASYDLPNIISVAATDQNDELAPYSNYGETYVDLGAPGTNVQSTIPLGGYAYKDGTSMSAPMVAGAVALAKSYRPDLSATAIKAAVLDSGDSIESMASTTVSGKRLNVNNLLLSLAPATTTPDTTAPIITLLGANPLTLTVGNSYVDPGAEVTDDTDATRTILGTGTVDPATAGTYTLTYSATDTAGNVATSTSRSVVVSVAAASGGGGGGGSSRRSGGGGGSSTVTKPRIEEPSVARFITSSAPVPQVLGASTFVFSHDLTLGSSGQDVTELQNTLVRLGFYSGPTSGYFGPLTQTALKAFQQSKGLEPAGRLGPQTRNVLNATGVTVAPTSASESLISSLQAQLQVLLAKLALLQAGT